MLRPLADPHELRRLLALSWPVVASQLGFMGLTAVDTMVVGHGTPEALPAVALAITWVFAWVILGRGTAMGMDPLLTQAHGARRADRFAPALATGACIVGALAVPVSALHFVTGPALVLLGQPPEVAPLAQAYGVAVAPAAPALMLQGLMLQALQATGRMRPGLVVAVVMNVVNLPADLLGMHALGPVGVGWSTSASAWVGLAVSAWLARDLLLDAWRARRQVAWRRVARVLSVALPVGFQVALEVWAFTIATLLAGALGVEEAGAHAVALRISAIMFMVPVGLGAAAATRVGNLVGAGRDWRPAARTALVLTAGVMAITAGMLWGAPEVLVGWFVDGGASYRALAVRVLAVAAAFQLFDGMQAVLFGILRGVGDTRAPALLNVLAFYGIGLPVAWWLSFRLGLTGVWVGLAIGLFVVAGTLLIRLVGVASRGPHAPT